MNSTIDDAREVILITAKSYGWDNWVKIRERVEMYPSLKISLSILSSPSIEQAKKS